MKDVLVRLMEWMELSEIDDADVVLRDAVTEIAGLRARLDELRRCGGGRADEESLRLTDRERGVILDAKDAAEQYGNEFHADTLAGLLSRHEGRCEK